MIRYRYYQLWGYHHTSLIILETVTLIVILPHHQAHPSVKNLLQDSIAWRTMFLITLLSSILSTAKGRPQN